MQGNVATDLLLGALLFDFTPPQVSGLEIESPGVLSREGTGYVRFVLDEAVAPEQLSVTLHGRPRPLVRQEDVTPPSYRFAYEVDANDTAGDSTLVISVSDAAANVRVETRNGFVFDFTLPALDDPAPVLLSATARDGQLAGVTFTVDELLAEAPLVQMTAGAAAPVDLLLLDESGTTYTYGIVIDAAAQPLLVPDGAYTLWLSEFYDLAQNAGTAVSLGELLVDTKRPLVQSLVAEPAVLRQGFGFRNDHPHLRDQRRCRYGEPRPLGAAQQRRRDRGGRLRGKRQRTGGLHLLVRRGGRRR